MYGLVLTLLVTSCQSVKVKTDKDRGFSPESTADHEGPSIPPPVEVPDVITPPPPPPAQIPKVAVIFGPGGARSIAGIGFLQELNKHRIPVHAVGGIEWGAVLAAYFSLKGSINDVEWQVAKIKDQDNMGDMSELRQLFGETLSKHRVENGKLPFVCPAFNITKNQTYMMNKGPFNQLLPYCLAYPPIFQPHQGNISGIRDIKSIADYLRLQAGANYVIFINVTGVPGSQKNLTGKVNSMENLFWNEIAAFYSKPLPGVNQVVQLNVDGYTVFDFNKKRDIIQRGATSASSWVQDFAKKYGF